MGCLDDLDFSARTFYCSHEWSQWASLQLGNLYTKEASRSRIRTFFTTTTKLTLIDSDDRKHLRTICRDGRRDFKRLKDAKQRRSSLDMAVDSRQLDSSCSDNPHKLIMQINWSQKLMINADQIWMFYYRNASSWTALIWFWSICVYKYINCLCSLRPSLEPSNFSLCLSSLTCLSSGLYGVRRRLSKLSIYKVEDDDALKFWLDSERI